MSEIKDWSTTAANNNAADEFPEGMAPSAVNDNLRTVLASLRTQHESAEWIDLGDTYAYATASSFTISGIDRTTEWHQNRRVKLVGDTTGYGYVTSSSFSTNTTVNVTMDSGSVPTNLTACLFGVLSATNTSTPQDVWTQGRDGGGTGLDADTLDAQEGSYYRNATNLNAGTVADARIAATSITQHQASVDHNALSNYVPDEHVNHTSVSITAGTGLTGGGSIAATRTLDLDINGLTADASPDSAADYVATYDADAGTIKKVLLDNLPAASGGDAGTLDGYDSTAFPRKAEAATVSGGWTYSATQTFNGGATIGGTTNVNDAVAFNFNMVSGTSPFTVDSTTVVTNLNADLLDGNHASAFLTGITGESIKNLSDVFGSMVPTDGQSLTWDNANSRWTATTVAASSVNSFETIAVSGQSNVVADSSTDTLTFAAGTGITITTTAASDTITITNANPSDVNFTSARSTKLDGIATGAEVNQSAFSNIAVSGQSTVSADTATDSVTFVGSGVTITTNATTDTVTFTADTQSDVNFTSAYQTKLDGIDNSADANQNAFSNVAVSGQSTIAADSVTDTLTVAAGSNISISTNAATDTMTIAVDNTGLDADTVDGVQASAFSKLATSESHTAGKATTVSTLTDAATVAVDAALSNVFTVTLAGNRTLGAPSNGKSGQCITIIVKQDATGSRTLAYNSTYKFPSGTAPTLSTAANAIDMLGFVYDGTNWYGTALLNFS